MKLKLLFAVWMGMLMSRAYTQNFPQQTPDYIQSIFFEVNGQMKAFPILGSRDVAILHFDDLRAQEADYFYSLKYFDHNWEPSTLFENEYLQGIAQGRIIDFVNAVNTIQPYTHYRLAFPNTETQPLLSGNYLVEVQDISGNIIFSRPFAISEERINIAGSLHRSIDLEDFQTHQRVQFSINNAGNSLRQPEGRLHVYVIQNRRWDKMQGPIPIQFNRGNQIDFRLDPLLQFNGENEFLFFDTKDARIPGPQTAYVESADLYTTHLHVDRFFGQSPYSWTADLNGRFQIQTVQNYGDRHQIADYTWVHFNFNAPAPNTDDRVFVLGHFNNFLPTQKSEMLFNPETGQYENFILLKQGVYNYQYYLSNSSDHSNILPLGGQHAQTENEYTVLVYYRDFGALHDALIGSETLNSFNLMN